MILKNKDGQYTRLYNQYKLRFPSHLPLRDAQKTAYDQYKASTCLLWNWMIGWHIVCLQHCFKNCNGFRSCEIGEEADRHHPSKYLFLLLCFSSWCCRLVKRTSVENLHIHATTSNKQLLVLLGKGKSSIFWYNRPQNCYGLVLSEPTRALRQLLSSIHGRYRDPVGEVRYLSDPNRTPS